MRPNTDMNPSCPDASFSPQFREQIECLHTLTERLPGETLADFDTKTEQLIRDAYGGANDRLEAYRYATMAEAESVVNLPESAQEETTQDLPKKAIQQRRQVLEGILSEMEQATPKKP